MKCKDVETLIEDYRSGFLGGRRHRALERHLSGCPECRGLLEEDEVLDRALETWPAPSPRPDFPERVARRLASAPLEAPRRVRVPLALAVGLGVLLVASLGANLLLLRHEPYLPADVPVVAGAPVRPSAEGASSLALLLPTHLELPHASEEAEPIFW